jgi:tetratricopeptide (TPR) repeat protein
MVDRPDTDASEDERAAQLERLHDRLRLGKSEPGEHPGCHGELSGEAGILELIERVRKHIANTAPIGERDTVIRSSASASPDAARPKTDSPFDSAPPVSRVGRFEIRQQLGEGGFGMVFRAFDPNLGRDVAIKVPRPETLFTPDLQRRFVREGRAAAALSHPGIVTVYEAGSEGSVCWLASEYVPGMTLAAWLQEHGRTPDPRDAASLVATLGEAMQHAHDRQVLHRDLKPANILLQTSGAEPLGGNQLGARARIADFGLARTAGCDDLKTQDGALVGTPAYMAPEQIRGSTDVGVQADVYSLGAILYELLTGSRPFRGTTLIDTVHAVQTAAPRPPRKIRGDIPEDLEAICLKCLEKEPARRYAGAQALAADLNRFLGGLPVEARPVGRIGQLHRWSRRNPALAATGAAALVLLLLALAATSAGWLITNRALTRESEALYTAQIRQQQLQNKSAQLTAAVERFFVSLATSEDLSGQSAEGLRRILLAEANRFQRDFLADAPEDDSLRADYARSLFLLGEINGMLGDFARARKLADQAIQELERVDAAPDRKARLGQWHVFVAATLTRQGLFDEANARFEVARKYFDLDVPPEQLMESVPHRATLLVHQAESNLFAGNVEAARQLADECNLLWQLVDSVHGPESAQHQGFVFERALTAFISGAAAEAAGDLAGASASFDRAVRLFDQELARTPLAPGVGVYFARCLRGQGIARALQEKFEGARESYGRALDILAELTANHPLVESYARLECSVRYSLAATELCLEHEELAAEQLKFNIEQMKSLVERFPEGAFATWSSLGDNYNLLAVSWRERDKASDENASEALLLAIDSFERAIAARPEWTRPKLALARAESNLASIALARGEPEEAMQWGEQAARRNRELLARQPDWEEARQSQCIVLADLTLACRDFKDFARALEYCDEFLPIGAGHGRLHEVRLMRALALARLGQVDASREELADCLTNVDPAVAMENGLAETLRQLAAVPELASDAQLGATMQSLIEQVADNAERQGD